MFYGENQGGQFSLLPFEWFSLFFIIFLFLLTFSTMTFKFRLYLDIMFKVLDSSKKFVAKLYIAFEFFHLFFFFRETLWFKIEIIMGGRFL